ncbi:alpha/beta fold hydrolase, partial [Actinomadura alba]
MYTGERGVMNKVISADGTPIAFERFGSGRPVVVVGGATCDRAKMREVSERLAHHFTVINYDRRGRGDSGDTAPYAVQREIEDLGALITEAGGTVSVYGHSSGAGLALHAAAHGLPITRLALHDPPFVPAGEQERAAREQGRQLRTLLEQDRRGDAAALFMTWTGVPSEAVAQMRGEPWWAGLEAIAHTLAYDSEVMGDISRGGTIPADQVGRVATATLVVNGGACPAWMIDAGRRIADGIPGGRQIVLADQEHVVPPDLLVPAIADFLAGRRHPD